ncbi:hypothetical protein HHI36_009839, partial [Cryptolaemus montrouzieri]
EEKKDNKDDSCTTLIHSISNPSYNILSKVNNPEFTKKVEGIQEVKKDSAGSINDHTEGTHYVNNTSRDWERMLIEKVS